MIAPQDVNGRPSDGREPKQPRPFPGEVVWPSVLPWAEQSYRSPGVGIDPCDVRAFVAVAGVTGEREIVGFAEPAVLLGDDVVNLEGGLRELLGELAVFTVSLGATADQLLQASFHGLRSGRGGRATH